MSFGSKNLPPQTPDERARIDQIVRHGCVACKMEGDKCFTEIHHLLVGGRRVGHRFTIGLCDHHHRTGQQPERGPSLAKGSKPFHDRYGTDQYLLFYQDRLIGWPCVIIPKRSVRKAYQPPSKIVPRAA